MLSTEMRNGWTDIVPTTGTPDYYQVSGWTPGSQANLSLPFRLQRAIRVIPVTEASMAEATAAIDGVVRTIEDRVAHERQSMQIKQSWPADSNDDDTCVACDFRVSCEHYNDPTRRRRGRGPS